MILFKAAIRGFEPLTAGPSKNVVERKEKLRDAILKTIEDTSVVKSCRDKDLSLNVCFNLYKDPKQSKAYEKDLDNLLKILLDVLSEHMDNTLNKKVGLGLIDDNHDYRIFEIHCRKKLVTDKAQEGLDIEISEHIQNKINQ